MLPAVEHKWQAPEVGSFKLNVDASIFKEEDHFSVGMVMRNHLGEFVCGETMRFRSKCQC